MVLFFVFYAKIQESWENDFWGKSPVDSADTLWVKNFVKITILLRFRDKHVFCVLRRNSKWPPKVAVKRFLEKSPVDSADTLSLKKFCRNCSVLLCFQDKPVFALNAEIQDGHQKWGKKRFLEKVASRLCRYPAGQKFRQNRSILLCFRDKCLFAFYAQIQHEKWRENDFWEKSPVDSADTLRIKLFLEIALSHSFSEINTFCVLRRNSRWPPKVVGKQFLKKVASRLWRYPAGQKFCRNRSILLRFQYKHFFSCFAQIQDGCQKWRENDLGEKSSVDSAGTLRVKNFIEITLSCSVSEPKVAGKRFLGKAASRLCRYPVDQKFCQNRFILLCFRDKLFLGAIRRYSRWPPKVAGKRFSGEVTSQC